jgi:hypothetical protein
LVAAALGLEYWALLVLKKQTTEAIQVLGQSLPEVEKLQITL